MVVVLVTHVYLFNSTLNISVVKSNRKSWVCPSTFDKGREMRGTLRETLR